MLKAWRRRIAPAMIGCVLALGTLAPQTATANEGIAQYEALLQRFRNWEISPKEFEARKRELAQKYGLQFDHFGKATVAPTQARPTPPVPGGPAPYPVAATMPACNSQAVQQKAFKAIYEDLGRLRLPTNNMQDIDDAVMRLAATDNAKSRQARQTVSRAGGIPLEYLLTCEPTNGHPLAVMVVQNPRRTSQWGVSVINYGLPGRVASQDLEFLN